MSNFDRLSTGSVAKIELDRDQERSKKKLLKRKVVKTKFVVFFMPVNVV